jgi:hypothetical protein
MHETEQARHGPGFFFFFFFFAPAHIIMATISIPEELRSLSCLSFLSEWTLRLSQAALKQPFCRRNART